VVENAKKCRLYPTFPYTFLTKIYLNDRISATDSMRTTVCWRTPWILRP